MAFHGALHALPLAPLRALFAAYSPDSASGAVRAKTRAALLALADDERALPRDGLPAFALLGALTTPRARRDIESSARITHFDLGRASLRESLPEVVARLLVIARTDRDPSVASAAAAVLRRAKRHAERRAPDAPTRQLARDDASAPHALDLSPRTRGVFAKELTAVLTKEHREPRVSLRGAFHRGLPALLVIRPDARLASVVFDGDDIAPLATVPASFDMLTFDEPRGRLGIETTDPRLVDVYRALAGRAFLADEAAFSARPTVTLRRLLTAGPASLDASRFRASIARVRLIQVAWDRGDNDVEILRGGDVLDALARRGVPLGVGVFIAAVVRIDFTGAPAAHVDVWLKPPHRVTWEASPHDDVVRAWLDATGFLSASAEKADLALASRAPLSLATWRDEVSPAVVDAWLAAGVLAKSETRVVPDPAQPSRARALLSFPDDDGVHHAIPEDDDDDAEPRLLDRAALEAFALDHAALAADVASRVARALDEATPRAPLPLDARANVFDLGAHQIGAARFHLFFAAGALDPPAWEDRLRARAAPLAPLVLVPRGPSVRLAIPTAPLPLPGDAPRATARSIATALGAKDGVPVHLLAPDGVRLAIDETRREIYLDGVLLARLTDQLFDYLTLLAKASGACVPTETINRDIGKNRSDAAAAKQLKRRLVDVIRASFDEARVTPPRDIAELVLHVARGGYKLAISAHVR